MPRRSADDDRHPLADFLISKLTSRKLWLALLGIGFAFWNYHLGALTPSEFQGTVTTIVLGYLGAEGVTDAAAAWGVHREAVRTEAAADAHKRAIGAVPPMPARRLPADG